MYEFWNRSVASVIQRSGSWKLGSILVLLFVPVILAMVTLLAGRQGAESVRRTTYVSDFNYLLEQTSLRSVRSTDVASTDWTRGAPPASLQSDPVQGSAVDPTNSRLTPPVPRDLTSYLESLAAVSGTVAAIVGGFVLSAILTRDSERRAAYALLSERRAALAEIMQDIDDARHQAALGRRSAFLDWLRIRLEGCKELPDPADFNVELEGLGFGRYVDELSALAAVYLEQRELARALLKREEAAIAVDTRLRTFDRWLVQAGPIQVDRATLLHEYNATLDSIRRLELLKSSVLPSVRVLADRDGTTAAVASDIATRLGSAPDEMRVVRLEADVRRVSQSVEEAEAQVGAMAPEGLLMIGLVLFAAMLSVGVLYPVSLLGFVGPTDQQAHAVPLLGSLLLQMVAVGLYAWKVRQRVAKPLT